MEWNDKIENQKKTNRKFYKCKKCFTSTKRKTRGRKLDKKKKKRKMNE